MIEYSKENYYIAMRRTQTTIRSGETDWLPWVTFFLRALQQQKQRLARKLEQESLLREILPELSLRILDLARDNGQITIGDIVRFTGANRNTVKARLRALVSARHFTQHGKGKGTWYGVA